jgi:hypothetical protein
MRNVQIQDVQVIKWTNRTLRKFFLWILLIYSCFSSSTLLVRLDHHHVFDDESGAKAMGPPPPPLPLSSIPNMTADIPKQQQQQQQHQQRFNYIPSDKLQVKDYFSGAFFMPVSQFQKLNVRHFIKLESASLEASRNRKTSKMLIDWTEFSVEHFSHWWKTMQIFEEEETLSGVLAIFQHYVQVTAPQQLAIFQQYHHQQQQQHDPPMRQAIAAIAFQPYKSIRNNNNNMTNNNSSMLLTAHSLAATIASLYVAGFGRILVVGYSPEDQIPVQRAFQILLDEKSESESSSSLPNTHTTLGYARITDTTWTRNYRNKKLLCNMQRGVVEGLQRALQGRMPSEQQHEWLGTKTTTTTTEEDWKYVFLTEPDLLLYTKPWILPLLQTGLNQGLSFFPHRLQPLPHQADFPSTTTTASSTELQQQQQQEQRLLLPNHVAPFSNITTLQYFQDSCCDEMTNEYPGRAQEFGWRQHQFPCDDWWWTCGYNNNNSTNNNNTSQQMHSKNETTMMMQEAHKRLIPYPMMRLQGGSGVVFGSTEQGRRCVPSKTRCHCH